MTGCRVVHKSSFNFVTDVRPSFRGAHPSGVLHAFRFTPCATPIASTLPIQSGKSSRREEHAFAWIEDKAHLESALNHFESCRFDREKMVFIPYSTKRNWLDQYPQALPVVECTHDGEILVGLGALGSTTLAEYAAGGTATALQSTVGRDAVVNNYSTTATAKNIDGETAAEATKERKRKNSRAMYKYNKRNMFDDNSLLPDAERDELHIEIYNYLSWLHAKLVEVEGRAAEATAAAQAAEADAESLTGNGTNEEIDGKNEKSKNEKNKHDGSAKKVGRRKGDRGIDLSELQGVLDKLEYAFSVIPNAKLEVAESASVEEDRKMVSSIETEKEGELQEAEKRLRQEKVEVRPPPQPKTLNAVGEMKQQKGVPLIEEELRRALARIVALRESSGKPKRRGRKKKRQWVGSGNPRGRPPKHPKMDHAKETKESAKESMKEELAENWDEMVRRLERYKEENGDCIVSIKYKGDKELAKWVKGLREKKALLRRKGFEFEVPPFHGDKLTLRTLTAERVETLESVGFPWIVGSTKESWVSWEERFQEAVAYHEENGRWPSQSMGGLGMWVHKQRQMYAKKDENYMTKRAPLLDEVGFEWTPRGNTKISWDEGFEMLMAYYRINGHFDVPAPTIEEGGEPVDRRSNMYRLHKWVESLHSMYRSYKLGRQSGSLNDERALLLIKEGFEFRDG